MFELRLYLTATRTAMMVATVALVAGCGGGGTAAEQTSSSGGTSTAPAPQAPAAPTGLVATPGSAQVSLAWSASTNATSYDVKRATASSGPFAQLGTTVSASYMDATAASGTTYFYVVSAVNSTGASADSAAASATVAGTSTPPVVQVPAAPTSLVAAPGNAQASLSWSASSGATSYHVKRGTTSGGPYTQVGAPTSTSYTDTALTNGTTYYYVVDALNAQGSSADSAAASVTPVAATSPATSLPAVTALNNVQLTMNGGSATITFDTVDNAVDYRVYELPANGNIQIASDGSVVIPNAIYRCAGTYQVPAPRIDDATTTDNGITARVASAVDGYTRSLGEATLGYVYTAPGAGLTPVYVVGNPDIHADDDYYYRYQASREKQYTTSATQYASLVASGWRDDGIAFYVPATASAATKPVLNNANLSDSIYGSRYYLNQGAELSSRSTSLGFATAFNVLTTQAAGSRPLMRVFYQTAGGRSHDELAVGQAGFSRIRYQGLNNPVASVHYSGITAATTLVVEALDKGCPFQAMLSSQSVAAQTLSFTSYTVAHQAWSTVADLQKTVDSGEVYLNGQFDGVVGRPKAIARAYVSVAPKVRPTMDWMSTAASFSETFTPLACGAPDGNCFQQFREQSSTYDISFLSAETGLWQAGNVLGELLINYADWAADTNGKVRITVKSQKATISSNSYVHATMEVNSMGSARRYPQLIISDQNIPVQYNLINGRSLILQTFGDFPSRIDLEICDHVTWDVNLQCPRYIFRHTFNSSGTISGINPIPEEDQYQAAVDAPTKFDLYTSNAKAYIFVNDKPYACANLASKSGVSPVPVAPLGAATVTFGDALYHSGADDNFLEKMPGGYLNRHQQFETNRHYDNLGFSSGVAAPAWDETKLPCSSTMTALNYDPSP